jgi:hypothetical protein
VNLTDAQRCRFDIEIEKSRDLLERRKALMALPSKRGRSNELARLRVVVDDLRRAAKAFLNGPAGYLSAETFEWLAEAEAVAEELLEKEKPSKSSTLQAGMTRPNQYREWLIGVEVPALHEKVFGERFANTLGGRSMEFARHVLKALGEKSLADETIKRTVTNGRAGGRTTKTQP